MSSIAAVLCDDDGTVTAEFAVVLPTVIAVLSVAIATLGLQIDRLQLVQLTAEAARAAARSEPVPAAQIYPKGDLVCVRLSRPTAFGFDLTDTECARREGN